MTYNPLIPNPPDKISQSQGNIKTNFGQLDAIFNNDHFKFSSATNNGLHKQIQLPVIPAVPSVSGAGAAIYTAADVGGITQLFFKNLTQTIQITSVPGTFGAVTSGWMVLPGGVKIAWGFDTSVNNTQGHFQIFFAGTAGLSFANVFMAYVVPAGPSMNGSGTIYMDTSQPAPAGTYQFFGFSNTSIYYVSTGTGVKAAYWFAIGN